MGEGSGKNPPAETGNGGYLFAHMTDANYGRLYYAISRDGISWKALNKGNLILSQYYGHPDLCEGPDIFGDAPRRWYMIGITPGVRNEFLVLWHSTDLVFWQRMVLDEEQFEVEHLGLMNEFAWFGAPKMFYDEASGQFIITWHIGQYNQRIDEMRKNGASWSEIEPVDRLNWANMRTCYTLTKDFVTFTRTKKLFAAPDAADDASYFTGTDENMGTIDVIIRKYDGKYYAIVKDERWQEQVPETYKTVRVASSDNLLGPYTNPGPSISPHWREAPCILRTPEGKFRLYYEAYTKGVYEMREADAIEGPWRDVALSGVPFKARHGCVVWVDEQTYQGLMNAYNY